MLMLIGLHRAARDMLCTVHLRAAPIAQPELGSAPSHPPTVLSPCSLHHKIDVTSASKHYSVWAAFGSGISGAASAPEREWPTDPRLPALGRRGEGGMRLQLEAEPWLAGRCLWLHLLWHLGRGVRCQSICALDQHCCC